MAAAGRVLSTYELLENILLHLPLRQILLSQRISKSFRDLVQRSPNLRRVLFLKPVSDDVVNFEKVHDTWRKDWLRESDKQMTIVMLNPFMKV